MRIQHNPNSTMSELELMDIIAGNLKTLMDEYGYSQKELAEASGVSEASISRYIKAERMPTLVSLFNISMALDCEPHDITGMSYWID